MRLKNLPLIEAVGFDLGETLLYYNDTPLNWESLYEPALTKVATDCGLAPSISAIMEGCRILRGYNTRLFPRESEIPSEQIFGTVLTAFGVPTTSELLGLATESFFGFFQQRTCRYPATLKVLNTLRDRGLPVGILTDVPYGMPVSFVQRDLYAAGIAELLSALITSGEVGWRKPNPTGFIALAQQLGTTPERLLFVGNEPKDVIGACQAGAQGVFLDHQQSGEKYGQHGTIHQLDELIGLLGP